MDLSVIIANWNTRQMLQDCLESLFRSGHPADMEVFVVDNASSDGSAEMVERGFPDVNLIRNARNVGFASANNQAMSSATGKYVLLLNSDTLVHGDVIARSYEYMERHPDVAVLGCRVLNADGTVQLTCGQFPSLLNLLLLSTGLWRLRWPRFFGRYLMTDWERDTERDVGFVTGCYMLVRSEAIRDVGMLDEAFFFFGEETDWCRRFREAGWRVRFAPVGEITHFGGGSARRLSSKRDVMLTSATVLLHLKHNGVVAAGLAWLILLAHNATRAVFWSLASLAHPSPEARARRDHFVGVLRDIRKTWPYGGRTLT